MPAMLPSTLPAFHRNATLLITFLGLIGLAFAAQSIPVAFFAGSPFAFPSTLWLLLPLVALLFLLHQALQVPQLEQATRLDSKTALLNARYFDQRLANRFARAQRRQQPLVLLMADLDLLRLINNGYGHLAGDAVLIGVSKIIQEAIHPNDLATRFGGEEFMILPHIADPVAGLALAERIRTAVAAASFAIPNSSESVKATISIGIAVFPPDADTITTLIHHADLALYQAKTTGRNRVVAYADLPAAVKAAGFSALGAVG